MGLLEWSRLKLRVLPTDLDINFHMNNGRYLTLIDLCRMDMFLRTGLLRLMLKYRWAPAISSLTMEFRKPLKLFQRYTLRSRIVRWDRRLVFSEHEFVVGTRVIARGTSNTCLVGRNGIVVPPAQIVKLLGWRAEAPGQSTK
ncbi:acyl-CoA thioesterase [Denitrobaculum tricleocarpae]|uniref:Acyl-CoA thioesterase n=2 Tax=Denitrobaculum tricleocarpae TaxID=2591009 RepID=A0A545TN86_9PROT|nr:acyl-CoA thioesterase [Denitrobaculum tricleocarpae]